jgi:hypothetical protein
MRWIAILVVAVSLLFASVPAMAKLTDEQKVILLRDLTAEMGTVQILLPRSKKTLDVLPDGTYDRADWEAALQEYGVAARLDDMVQITSVRFTEKRLIMVINYGLKGGAKWWHRIQLGAGGGNRNTEMGSVAATHAPGGTELALFFKDGLPDKTAEEFKALLKNVLNFEIRSATEHYLDQVEPEFKEAIGEQEVISGMDKEMVLLAKDRPDRKYRDFENGVETEDWIYGTPPGEIVFVTFQDGKVINVKYEHASLGGAVEQSKPIDR